MPILSCGSEPMKRGIVSVNNTEIMVEIAYTRAERSQGLMRRQILDKNSGMLVLLPYDRKPSFWMKNTSITLSIEYIYSDLISQDIKSL